MSTHEYPEPDDEDGFLYVREMGDLELIDEYCHVLRVLEAMAEEVDFRLDDDRSMITADDLPSEPTSLDHLIGTIRYAQGGSEDDS